MSDIAARPFRFGHQLRPAGSIDELVAEARRAEAAGFDVVSVPDHVGESLRSPMLALAALAMATDTVRLATFVINNEMRNPVQLAWEATTLDHLSGGRFELGLGAGHTPHEFDATGIALAPARDRKDRLAEAVEIIRALLDGETVTRTGGHYDVRSATIERSVQDRLPVLVGGNGTALLSHAARHADIVGLNGLGRTQPDGHRHAVRFELEHLDRQVETIRNGAADRDLPELNALVQRVTLTDDREATFAEEFADAGIEGLTADIGLATPYLAIGTHDEIAAQFGHARDRWGLTYFTTRDIDAMAPVIERLRDH